MKREISPKKTITTIMATLTSVVFLTATADAQIFGGLRQGLFGNRDNDCCPQIQSQCCCLPGNSWNHGGWGGGSYWGGNWGTPTWNQGQAIYQSPSSYDGGTAYNSYGSAINYGTGSSMGLSSNSWTSGGQVMSGNQIFQSPTVGPVGSDGTQYSGNTQGNQSGQLNSTQNNSTQSSSNQGQLNDPYRQGSSSSSTAPQTGYNSNPNYSGNSGAGNVPSQTQPHNAYSVRADQYQPNSRPESGNWSNNPMSEESINKSMSCFIASKFALQNESAADAASQIMDRLKSSDVKDLAKQIADDHGKLAVDFRTIATSGQANTSAQPGDQQPNMNQNKLGPFTALYEMCERADEQQKEQMDKMMSDLSEDEIDMGYVGTLLVCHRSMLAELKAAQETVNNNELKSKLDSAIETVQSHLEKTEEVYEKLTS